MGDPSLVTHDLAADFIPGLVDFLSNRWRRRALESQAGQEANPERKPVASEPESSNIDRSARAAFGRLFGRGDG